MPLDFDFPLDASYADHAHEQHVASCPKTDHDDCVYDWNPPKGDGWQLWQTVSDGPVTPVFKTAEELIDYMSQPVPPERRTRWAPEAYPEMPCGQGWRREIAEPFVRSGRSAPSLVVSGGKIISGPEAVVRGIKPT